MITGLGAFSTVIAAWSRCTVLSIHPDLRRYVLTALWVSGAVGIAGIGSLALGLTGMISGGSPEWPFLLFGVVALLSSHLGLVLVPRWYRRSSTIVSSAQPTSGHILLELESDSDSTSLYATVVDTGPRSRSRHGPFSRSWARLSTRISIGTLPRSARSPSARQAAYCVHARMAEGRLTRTDGQGTDATLHRTPQKLAGSPWGWGAVSGLKSLGVQDFRGSPKRIPGIACGDLCANLEFGRPPKCGRRSC